MQQSEETGLPRPGPAHLRQQRLAALDGAAHRRQLDGVGDHAPDQYVLQQAGPGAAGREGR